jgi:hypothetical protein
MTGFALFIQQGSAQDVLVKIDNITAEEIKYAGFILDNEQEIKIEAIGTHRRSRHWITSTAWILNTDNRELVWELTDANSKWKSRKLREYRDAVTLPQGKYEVYYCFFPEQYHGDEGWSFYKFFFGDHDRYDKYSDVYGDFSITLFGKGKKLNQKSVQDYQKQIKEKAVVALTANRDDRYMTQGFKLDKPLDLIVYSIGEAKPDGTYDYGWIINADTREQVWKFTHRNTDYAGGNEKNRRARENISLPAGSYAAFYVADDSHSPESWNASPPYDPAFWGLTIYTRNEADRNAVRLFDYEDFPVKNVVIEFTRLGDDEFVTRGFTLKKDMNLRIYAIGEGMKGEMFDYGWIIEAKTHKRVWEMDFRDTEHAGGNSKNRLYDKVVPFKKGNYILHYITDDSHSYRDWNASPPFDRERWGITLIGVGENFNPKDVVDYNEEEDRSVLATIVRVGDNESRQERFTLQRDGEVRVYALGEGRNGEMYDYAWIEKANSKKIVWEMTYRKTTLAGGDRKNRLFDDIIFLQAGDYIVHYESDDSHSYRDWNASPPRDPVNWGITIYKVVD